MGNVAQRLRDSMQPHLLGDLPVQEARPVAALLTPSLSQEVPTCL
jgi:hypothetical protein